MYARMSDSKRFTLMKEQTRLIKTDAAKKRATALNRETAQISEQTCSGSKKSINVGV